MPSRQLRFTHALATAAIAVSFTTSAQAAVNRAFVSAQTGNDANTSVGCPPTNPCRTFQAGISVLNPGGDIVITTDGGYGPVTITQSVSIFGGGGTGFVTAATGDGITINATGGTISLSGLNLNGVGTGHNGVTVLNGIAILDNVVARNFNNAGIDLEGSDRVTITDSKVLNSVNGIVANNAGSLVFIQDTYLDGNGVGLASNLGLVTAKHLTLTHSSTAGATVAGTGGTSILELGSSFVSDNAIGVNTQVGGEAILNNNNFSFNTTGVKIGSGSGVQSYGNNAGLNPVTGGTITLLSLQ